MRQTTISKGGQISVPADIRRRWRTTRVLVEDRGDSLLVRPLPDDPIGAAMGSLAGPGPTGDEARAMLRDEDAGDEDRRWGTR